MDWSYVAGFMDGEGHVSYKETQGKRGKTLKHSIGCCQSTPQDLCLREIKKFLDLEGIESRLHIAKSNGPRRHPVSILYLVGDRKDKIRFLEKIIPLSYVKRRNAEILVVLLREQEERLDSKKRVEQAWKFYCEGHPSIECEDKFKISGETLRRFAIANGYKMRSLSESTKLAFSSGRKFGVKRKNPATCCRKGHPYVEGSYRMNGIGGRICKVCREIYLRTYVKCSDR